MNPAPQREDLTDILGDVCTQSPYAYFDQLRAHEPVHWNARHRAWLITSHAAVSEGLRDPRLLSNRMKKLRESLAPDKQATVGRTLRLLEDWMVFQDNPDHRRVRSVVQKTFTPATVLRLEPDIRALAREQVALLRQRLEAEPDKPIDVLNEIAYEIPGPVICKMLGVPAEDRYQFIEWTEEVSSVIGGFADDPERYEKTHAAVSSLEDYLTRIITEGRVGESNLMAQLVAAEADGERLTRSEVIATGILLLFAGNRTTSCMIANGTRALALHPDQLERLRADPTLINAAVEEILRWESHTKATVRIVGEDFEWHGQRLRAGERVFLSPLAANRDPSVFDEPVRFDIRRPNVNRHIAFGTGVHLCLGMALARLELRTFLSEMLDTLPHLRLVDPGSRWLPSIVSRVQRELWVTAKSP
ncbi:MAG: cytochrome hydroxylase [Panacagrimonas sp.]|nr:cytochrome P450 [Panacagrimonas sp.]MCC2658709.1 cytochrome hydroxylase [Panacagrimonas sp.]